jgi:hypothetical protein
VENEGGEIREVGNLMHFHVELNSSFCWNDIFQSYNRRAAARIQPFAMNIFSKLIKPVKSPAIIGAKESPA